MARRIVDGKIRDVLTTAGWNARHEIMLHEFIKNPLLTNKQMAEIMGMNYEWCARIRASPIFRQRVFDHQRAELTEVQKRDLHHQAHSLLIQGAEVLSKRLADDPSARVALKCLDAATEMLALLKK